ncbi:hypothetical protein WJX84_006262, partial [Apatococcus fuscideae]
MPGANDSYRVVGMSSSDLASQHNDHPSQHEGEHNGGSRSKGPADNGVRSPTIQETGRSASKRTLADHSDRHSDRES